MCVCVYIYITQVWLKHFRNIYIDEMVASFIYIYQAEKFKEKQVGLNISAVYILVKWWLVLFVFIYIS